MIDALHRTKPNIPDVFVLPRSRKIDETNDEQRADLQRKKEKKNAVPLADVKYFSFLSSVRRDLINRRIDQSVKYFPSFSRET